jgi:hypothetical protein
MCHYRATEEKNIQAQSERKKVFPGMQKASAERK